MQPPGACNARETATAASGGALGSNSSHRASSPLLSDSNATGKSACSVSVEQEDSYASATSIEKCAALRARYPIPIHVAPTPSMSHAMRAVSSPQHSARISQPLWGEATLSAVCTDLGGCTDIRVVRNGRHEQHVIADSVDDVAAHDGGGTRWVWRRAAAPASSRHATRGDQGQGGAETTRFRVRGGRCFRWRDEWPARRPIQSPSPPGMPPTQSFSRALQARWPGGVSMGQGGMFSLAQVFGDAQVRDGEVPLDAAAC